MDPLASRIKSVPDWGFEASSGPELPCVVGVRKGPFLRKTAPSKFVGVAAAAAAVAAVVPPAGPCPVVEPGAGDVKLVRLNIPKKDEDDGGAAPLPGDDGAAVAVAVMDAAVERSDGGVGVDESCWDNDRVEVVAALRWPAVAVEAEGSLLLLSLLLPTQALKKARVASPLGAVHGGSRSGITTGVS